MSTVANDFWKECYRLLVKCNKPDRDEYRKIVRKVFIGFVIMGLIGFFVKLMFVPINQIILGGSG